MNMQEARKRAEELVAKLTPEEKISQLVYDSPAIERLGIHEYNWWNEASHGVARSGMATVFPHAIALASTFDPELLDEVGDAVSTEGRAKYNKSVEHGDRDIYKGLTYWTPNINIFRDPRWGRGQETFGEDPYLTTQMALHYIHGLQGDGEFLKASACSKHFAVHSGPESLRHTFNAVVSKHDLYETYLPAFEWTVKEAHVTGVMGAYNALYGYPCCAMPIIRDVLRKEWGFDGYFVSDCGAIRDIYSNHKFSPSLPEAAAVALKAGCNLNCGEAYKHLVEAWEEDLITDEDLTEANVQLFAIRFLLGEFEENRPYTDIPYSKIECREHWELNRRAAQESIVLLKNDGILPLDPATEKTIAVIGPNAMNIVALEGNYNGMSSEYVTPVDGIRKVFPKATVRAAKGCNIFREKRGSWGGFEYMTSEAVSYAECADYVVLCLGLDCTVEGEENGIHNDFFEGGDKKTLFLPNTQRKMAEAVCAANQNVIILLMAGSAVDLGDVVTAKARAIMMAWYPGALGGLAAAEIMAGVASPSGKLPVTFYRDSDPLPEFTDYNMTGRTYRYLETAPMYPFGFGLSYTSFDYSGAALAGEDEKSYKLTVTVKNTGKRSGVEKAQVYAQYTDSRIATPNYQLCGVKALELEAGESRELTFDIPKYWVSAVLDDGVRCTPDGMIAFWVGGHQPDERSAELTGTACRKVEVQ